MLILFGSVGSEMGGLTTVVDAEPLPSSLSPLVTDAVYKPEHLPVGLARDLIVIIWMC